MPAVALFVERARAVDPAFRLDATTAPAVVDICRRLDGIPLAIELAAARARALDVAEIARRLDERFRLLRGVRRGSDPATGRSRTPSAGPTTCSPTPRSSCSRHWRCSPASDDMLDLLTRLTERSMLAVRRPSTGGTRYELLETLREFGRNRLDGLVEQLGAEHSAELRRIGAALPVAEVVHRTRQALLGRYPDA